MGTKIWIAWLVWALALTACNANPQAPAAVSETAAAEAPLTDAIFQTEIGDMRYLSARFVDEVHGVTPNPGHKLLLVRLEPADGAELDLQKFQEAHMQIFIEGDDDSSSLSTMAGFVEDGFVIGFQVPDTIQTYTLVWGDNPPLDISSDLG